MLDINKRVRCEETTVAEMIEALQRLLRMVLSISKGKRMDIFIVIQRVKQ